MCLMDVFPQGNITNRVFWEHGVLSSLVLMVYSQIETVLSYPGIQPVITKYHAPARVKIRPSCVLSTKEWNKG